MPGPVGPSARGLAGLWSVTLKTLPYSKYCYSRRPPCSNAVLRLSAANPAKDMPAPVDVTSERSVDPSSGWVADYQRFAANAVRIS